MRPPRLAAAAIAALAALTGLAACAGAPTQVAAQAQPLWNSASLGRPTKVLVVVEENKTAQSALRGMPYLASLASKHGRAAAYRAITHPSLPNYLAMAGGSTFGVRDDAGPQSHPLAGPSVFDRGIAGGRTARTYAESMPTACGLSATTSYAVKHNPWVYFADPASRANCRRYNLPAGTSAAGALRRDIDAGRLPNVGLLIPNICNDGHDCPLATADNWLKDWLTVVQRGPDYRAGRLAIIITFDEDDTSGDNSVLTVVVSPYTSRVVSNRPFTHYSLTRYFAELTATTPLRAAANAPSLRSDFRI